MTHNYLVFAFVINGGFLAGCDSSEKSEVRSESYAAADRSGEQLRTETKKASHASGHYAYAQKDEFTSEMKKDLRKLGVDLERFEGKVSDVSGEAKTEATAKIYKLRQKVNEAEKKLDDAERSHDESAWEGVQTDAKKARDEAKESLETTNQWLSEKIASADAEDDRGGVQQDGVQQDGVQQHGSDQQHGGVDHRDGLDNRGDARSLR